MAEVRVAVIILLDHSKDGDAGLAAAKLGERHRGKKPHPRVIASEQGHQSHECRVRLRVAEHFCRLRDNAGIDVLQQRHHLVHGGGKTAADLSEAPDRMHSGEPVLALRRDGGELRH